MTDLRLKIATIPYDRIDPLRTGDVVPDGLTLDYETDMPGHSIFLRMVENREFDVSEMSLGLHCTARARGDFPFVALPVYVSRMFRHGNVFVHKRSGITSAKDLEGRRVGSQEYRQSTLIWARGLLRDEHEVDTRGINWVEGGVNKPRKPSPTDLQPPPGVVSIEQLGEQRTLSQALEDGDIDALICARKPRALQQSEDVVRLFPDHVADEKDYYRRTGIFPIMHIIVMREELYAEQPWVAQSLFDAFSRAKAQAWKRLHFGALAVMSPWLHEQVNEMDELFGGHDPFPYGLERNRVTLETFTRYLVEDGLLESAPDPTDLFVQVDETVEAQGLEPFYW